MDKLTIAPPITVRVTLDESERIGRSADFYGMNKSEYIRHLIDADYEVLKGKYEKLSPLFSGSTASATDTPHDDVGRFPETVRGGL